MDELESVTTPNPALIGESCARRQSKRASCIQTIALTAPGPFTVNYRRLKASNRLVTEALQLKMLTHCAHSATQPLIRPAEQLTMNSMHIKRDLGWENRVEDFPPEQHQAEAQT